MPSNPLPVLPDAPRYSAIIGRPMDNTALSTYMRCPAEYEKAYRQHRRSGGTTPALAFGTVIHCAMEAHYSVAECSEADLIEQVHLAMAEGWQDHGVEDDIRTFDRAFLEYKKFLRISGLPWREESKTVGWPDRPLVEQSGEVAIPGARHPYAYKIDRIYKAQNQYFVEDHKTTSRFDKNFFRQFELDNQMMGYAYCAQLITGKPIAGVRISAWVIHKNDSLFEKRTISFSQVRLDDWARNYDRWLDKVENSYRNMETNIGFSKEPTQDDIEDAFPLNLWACHGRKYGSCPYIGVCSMPPHLRQRTLEQDFNVAPWNPLTKGEDDAESL
jgi:hypothetical protein